MKRNLLLPLLICCLVASGACQLDQRLVDALRNLPAPITPLPTSAPAYPLVAAEWIAKDSQPMPTEQELNGIKGMHTFVVNMPSINNIFLAGGKRLFQTHIFSMLMTIKFTKRVKILNFESWFHPHVNCFSTYQTKIAYIMAERKGDTYSMRGVDGSGSRMIYYKPDMIWLNGWPQFHAWDFKDYENGIKMIERDTLQRMFETAKFSTGLGHLPSSLGSAQDLERKSQESTRMTRFYSKVDYTVAETEDYDVTDLAGYLNQASNGFIVDGGVISRMVQLSAAAVQANFVYVARDNTLFYLTTYRTGAFKVELRKYLVEGGLPVNAFMTSTGAWSIETYGQGTRISAVNLMEEFKPVN